MMANRKLVEVMEGGVTWENLGRLKTRHVAVLWIYCNGLVTVLTVTDRSM